MRKVVTASLADGNIWPQCATTGWMGADGYFVLRVSAQWADPISKHIRSKWIHVPQGIKYKNTWLLHE
jgi:hypothetical protein